MFADNYPLQVLISRGFIYINPTIESVTHGMLSNVTDELIEKLKLFYLREYRVKIDNNSDLLYFLFHTYFRAAPDFKLAGKKGTLQSFLDWFPKLITTDELREMNMDDLPIENNN